MHAVSYIFYQKVELLFIQWNYRCEHESSIFVLLFYSGVRGTWNSLCALHSSPTGTMWFPGKCVSFLYMQHSGGFGSAIELDLSSTSCKRLSSNRVALQPSVSALNFVESIMSKNRRATPREWRETESVYLYILWLLHFKGRGKEL